MRRAAAWVWGLALVGCWACPAVTAAWQRHMVLVQVHRSWPSPWVPRVPPPHSGRVWGALDSLVPGIQSKGNGLESRPVRESPAAPCSGGQLVRTNDSSYMTRGFGRK